MALQLGPQGCGRSDQLGFFLGDLGNRGLGRGQSDASLGLGRSNATARRADAGDLREPLLPDVALGSQALGVAANGDEACVQAPQLRVGLADGIHRGSKLGLHLVPRGRLHAEQDVTLLDGLVLRHDQLDLARQRGGVRAMCRGQELEVAWDARGGLHGPRLDARERDAQVLAHRRRDVDAVRDRCGGLVVRVGGGRRTGLAAARGERHQQRTSRGAPRAAKEHGPHRELPSR